MPLKVIESPYREITKPVLDYVKRIRTDNPRDVVTVFIPEYVVGHWWEQILHNQSALRLKGRLLFQPGVMVTSVPWQLASSERVATRRPETPPGSSAAATRRPAAGRIGGRGAPPTVPRPGRGRHDRPCDRPRLDRPDPRARGRAGRARRALRRPVTRAGWCSSGTRCRASGCGRVVTEDGGGSFCRGDAVAVLHAVAGRVPAPLPAGPGPAAAAAATCSTLDPAAQRALKAAVVAEQLRRLAGLERGGAGRGAARRPAGLAHPGAAGRRRRRAGPGCARTAATTCCRSPTARWPRRARCPRCSGATTTPRDAS